MGYGATVYSLDTEKVFNVLKNERNPELEKSHHGKVSRLL